LLIGAKFKRFYNSEVINTKKAKGTVILFFGNDAKDTNIRNEMLSFMEEDPLIVKDIVDDWNIQVCT
jgi:hypothetical protein